MEGGYGARGGVLAHISSHAGRSKFSSASVLEPAVLLGSLGLLGSVVRSDESGALAGVPLMRSLCRVVYTCYI